MRAGCGDGRVAFPPRLLRWAIGAALAAPLLSCATGIPRRRAATAERTAAIVRRWESCRAEILGRPPLERFYDARARRSVFSGTFVAAVRDDPGRSLSVVVEGPLGVPIARARWDGERTTVERSGTPAKRFSDEASPGSEPPLADIGVPLSARALSLLLVGLPDTARPDVVELTGDAAWLTFRGSGLACEFDAEQGRVRRVLSLGRGRRVDVRYGAWEGGVPSRIAIRVSGRGSADLVARPGDSGA